MIQRECGPGKEERARIKSKRVVRKGPTDRAAGTSGRGPTDGAARAEAKRCLSFTISRERSRTQRMLKNQWGLEPVTDQVASNFKATGFNFNSF